MAPSADLQRLEGRQVHKCVAGYAGDDIAEQDPADESRLAGEWGNVYICGREELSGQRGGYVCIAQ